MRLRAWEWAALALLVLAFVAQAGLASPQKSASFDEQYHLTAGYSYLRTGDFRMATTHPPLAGMIAALPLLARQDIALPLDSPLWDQGRRYDFSDVFLWDANGERAVEMLVQARWGITLLGALLLIAIFLWARRLLGPGGALLALTLAAFDPNLIANARLVTTDLPLTALLFMALWRLWCWLERPRGYDLVAAGVLGGLTMAAKYNGLLVWPVALAAALVYAPASRKQALNWQRRALGVVAMGGIGLGALWAVYRFQFGPPALLPLRLPLPAPFFWDHLFATFSGLLAENAAKPDFLLGQVSMHGWWYYFPVALGVKTPLPLLILLALGIAGLVRRQELRRQSAVWLPPLAFLLLGLTGVLTIGYRHMLPAIPFAIMLAGNSVEWLKLGARRRIPRWLPATVGGLLVAWAVLGAVRFFPHQEAYFNELAGDWRNWSNLLVDSNLDWGQDLPALRELMARRGLDSVNLAYFGKGVPERYGVRYRPLPSYLRFMEGREVNAYNPYTPEPGWYAVSATSLRLGTLGEDTSDLYAYFRTLQPVDRAGYSIYLYHVEDAPGTAVVRPVVVDTPVFRLKPEQLRVAPGVRSQPKWLQAGGSTVYPQGQDLALPAAPAYHPVGANLGGVFTLLGWAQEPAQPTPGQPLTVTLYWQVGEQPMPQPAPTKGAPVSTFVHVVDGDPANRVAQADGWEVALRGLEPGDVIAQKMTIDVPADLAPKQYTLIAGLYSPQDGSRLSTLDGTGQPVDHVTLGQVQMQERIQD